MKNQSHPIPTLNVSSVKLRSPFRYPGGKTWLVPHVRQWLDGMEPKPAEFIEPFAGGGIISLTVAAEQLADHVIMVERDEGVASVWWTILEGEIADAEWLIDRITHFSLTDETVEAELSKKPRSRREEAFQTILRNRISRGGILAPGAGRLKYGENGKGVKSRWYPQTLRNRMLNIIKIRDRIGFIEGDGFDVLDKTGNNPNAVFFIDPPYTAGGKNAGKRLYKYFEVDHEKLFQIASELAGDFLMTYENADEIGKLAQKYGFITRAVAMKSTHHAKLTELLVGRKMDWLT